MKRSQIIESTVEIEIEICSNCGTHFGIDAFLLKRLRSNKQTFYCPNGHSLWYGESDSERKIKKLEAQLQEEQTDRRYIANQLKDTQRSLSATKAAHTRTKNRIHKGICPVCNRQFENLHRHMEGQHPKYLEQPQ